MRLYYKVPRSLDGKPCYKRAKDKLVYNGEYLIEGELYTEKECRKKNIPFKNLIPVSLKKSEIYWCFGVRFPVQKLQ